MLGAARQRAGVLPFLQASGKRPVRPRAPGGDLRVPAGGSENTAVTMSGESSLGLGYTGGVWRGLPYLSGAPPDHPAKASIWAAV